MAYSPVKCEIPKNTRPMHLKIFRTQYIFVANCFDGYERVFHRAKGHKLSRLIFFLNIRLRVCHFGQNCRVRRTR